MWRLPQPAMPPSLKTWSTTDGLDPNETERFASHTRIVDAEVHRCGYSLGNHASVSLHCTPEQIERLCGGHACCKWPCFSATLQTIPSGNRLALSDSLISRGRSVTLHGLQLTTSCHQPIQLQSMIARLLHRVLELEACERLHYATLAGAQLTQLTVSSCPGLQGLALRTPRLQACPLPRYQVLCFQSIQAVRWESMGCFCAQEC